MGYQNFEILIKQKKRTLSTKKDQNLRKSRPNSNFFGSKKSELKTIMDLPLR